MKHSIFTYLIFISCSILFITACGGDPPPLETTNNAQTPPTAKFNVDDLYTTNTEVSFDDNSDSGSASITSWQWNFEGGNPSSSNAQNPTVNFSTKGEYTVSLTVTTPDGTNTLDKEILVIEDCPLYSCEKFLVEKSSDLTYGTNANSHRMNIYKPLGDNRSSKPAILINGGGNYNGSNLDLLDDLASQLASYGYVVATAKYRNGIQNPTGSLLRGMVDSKAAIRYLRSQATNYGINPNQIFAGGWSSGAYNALVHTYWQESDLPTGMLTYIISQGWISSWEGSQGHQGYSSNVAGVINLAGAFYGTEEAFENDLYITSSDKPMFSIIGELDSETPCGKVELSSSNWEFGPCIIQKRLQDVGLVAEMIVLQGGTHESPRIKQNIDSYLPSLVEFINDNL
ncbi:MAG: hypothetical protein CMB99_08935 [Flavobacteriaceae bacterium]|nr:hypothetical protein [Flavobacteriaceae bacterium]|tara:strand:- start:549776 stop:550972 length:1197 start_codon:yes stop_codon:yes gene_type:complete